jgi:hypothetical protein
MRSVVPKRYIRWDQDGAQLKDTVHATAQLQLARGMPSSNTVVAVIPAACTAQALDEEAAQEQRRTLAALLAAGLLQLKHGVYDLVRQSGPLARL